MSLAPVPLASTATSSTEPVIAAHSTVGAAAPLMALPAKLTPSRSGIPRPTMIQVRPMLVGRAQPRPGTPNGQHAVPRVRQEPLEQDADLGIMLHHQNETGHRDVSRPIS
jgi:hypothetical protein